MTATGLASAENPNHLLLDRCLALKTDGGRVGTQASTAWEELIEQGNLARWCRQLIPSVDPGDRDKFSLHPLVQAFQYLCGANVERNLDRISAPAALAPAATARVLRVACRQVGAAVVAALASRLDASAKGDAAKAAKRDFAFWAWTAARLRTAAGEMPPDGFEYRPQRVSGFSRWASARQGWTPVDEHISAVFRQLDELRDKSLTPDDIYSARAMALIFNNAQHRTEWLSKVPVLFEPPQRPNSSKGEIGRLRIDYLPGFGGFFASPQMFHSCDKLLVESFNYAWQHAVSEWIPGPRDIFWRIEGLSSPTVPIDGPSLGLAMYFALALFFSGMSYPERVAISIAIDCDLILTPVKGIISEDGRLGPKLCAATDTLKTNNLKRILIKGHWGEQQEHELREKATDLEVVTVDSVDQAWKELRSALREQSPPPMPVKAVLGLIAAVALLILGAVATHNSSPFAGQLAPPLPQKAEEPALALESVAECSQIPDGIKMVSLSGNLSFTMGSAERPIDGYECATPHNVVLSPFMIAQYEIDQDEFHSIMGWCPQERTDARMPVYGITYFDAIAFCNKLTDIVNQHSSPGSPPVLAYRLLGPQWDEHHVHILAAEVEILAEGRCSFRLPTEAEWEYAARGGVPGDRPWWFGDSRHYLKRFVRYCEDPKLQAEPPLSVDRHPDGKSSLHPFKLYHMNGNVEEWCEDALRPLESTAKAVDPRSSYITRHEERVVRGGSATSSASWTRSAARHHYPPAIDRSAHPSQFYVGLRIARSLPPQTDADAPQP